MRRYMASRPGTLDLALKRKPEAFASRYSVRVDVVHPYVYLVDALDARSRQREGMRGMRWRAAARQTTPPDSGYSFSNMTPGRLLHVRQVLGAALA